MSHLPEQPWEVPFRYVEHEELADRDDTEGRDFIGGVGVARDREWWGDARDVKVERDDLLRRDRARARLGGFGFR